MGGRIARPGQRFSDTRPLTLLAADTSLVGTHSSMSFKHTITLSALFFSSVTPEDNSIMPDGKPVASTSDDRMVRPWGATTGAARRTLRGRSGWVYAVIFSPDSKLVASASDDHTARLWDAAFFNCCSG
jgi:WD40 repeat protein